MQSIDFLGASLLSAMGLVSLGRFDVVEFRRKLGEFRVDLDVENQLILEFAQWPITVAVNERSEVILAKRERAEKLLRTNKPFEFASKTNLQVQSARRCRNRESKGRSAASLERM